MFETHVDLLVSPCLSVALAAAPSAIVELDGNKTVCFSVGSSTEGAYYI